MDNKKLKNLTTLLQIQMVTLLVYGLTFFLVPEWTLGTIFSVADQPPPVWPRVIGGLFLAVTYFEYLLLKDVEGHLEMVWVLFLVPFLLLLAFLWEWGAGGNMGSDLFLYVSLGVTGFFTLGVGILRRGVG